MQSILVVRLSAFGDQLQCAPLVTDLARRFPGCAIDWAVAEHFADVPRRHRHVRRVIALPLGRWRSLRLPQALREIAAEVRALRSQRYDAVLDAQGLWKSAIVARVASAGERVGFAPVHCGEPPAARLYDRCIHLPPGLHSAHRLRALGAAAFGTDAAAPIDYGLHWGDAPIDEIAGAAQTGAFAVLAHAASRPHKLWRPAHWVTLGRHLVGRGLRPVLPWGSDAERRRAERLARAIGPACLVPPRSPIDRWAATLARAAVVVGVDTGLTHLAACLGTPTLAIYTATAPEGFAPVDSRSCALGRMGAAPGADEVVAAADGLLAQAGERATNARPVAA